ncbi:MAG TPA: NifB/NifX family molybdenum-iron cluster-binding protein [Nitrospirota bacterium]|nr:NifB/NifX family molybdenum-iron cluster-binding protein [Nitrospirota bacterium]
MKLCFPVQHDEGIESKVHNHFGSALLFMVVDNETNSMEMIRNGDLHHVHGACNPLKAIDNIKIDVVIASGIGAGALSRLNQLGIRVYRASQPTIKENIALFNTTQLSEYALKSCCGGHGLGGTCSH